MKTNSPAVYKADMTVKQTPDIVGGERAKNGGKAKARYPHKPLGNVPGGSADTKGSFKRAYTPGTSPSGS
jgi:hypothetical protein